MATADVAALWDRSPNKYNSGFIVVKPTNASKRLYQIIRSNKWAGDRDRDQRALNKAINVTREQNIALDVTLLNTQRFLSGQEYFEIPQRWFAPDRQKCVRKKNNCAVVVYNNWIVTKAAKIYRFRENLMWVYDGDDQYYTSDSRLYLTYVNHPTDLSPGSQSTDEPAEIVQSEMSALKTAMTICYVLNRTIILPMFHIGPESAERPLNSLLQIECFDKYFSGITAKVASYFTRKSRMLSNPDCPYKW